MARPTAQPRSGATTVHVPLRLRRVGGRKRVMTPDGSEPVTVVVQSDSALLRAIVKAHRWRTRLESGEFSSIAELAAAEEVTQSYACRIMRLAGLSPRIVEAVLEGRQGPEVRMATMLRPFSAVWGEQSFGA